MTAIESAFYVARQRGSFDTAELVSVAKVSRPVAERLVSLLCREGLLEKAGTRKDGHGVFVVYQWQASPPVTAPACLFKGGAPRTKLVEKVWTAIRVKNTFTTADLVQITGAKMSYVQRLVKRLSDARIIRKSGRVQPDGQPGSYITYRLVVNSGPKPPPAMRGSRRAGG